MTIKPFFSRFLETQNTTATRNLAPANTQNPITMHTMKYPSDNETFDPKDLGFAINLRREALPDPAYAVKLIREALHTSDAPPLKPADTGGNCKPGDVVTLAFPSDSDAMEGRLRF